MRTFLLYSAVATLLAGQAAAAQPMVTIADAWCRATPKAAPAAACYLTLLAPIDDRLTDVESPSSARAEIHTMDIADGVMRMRRLPEGIQLPAGRAVTLRPGAEHLMLIGPKAPLAPGDTVTLLLTFAKAAPVRMTAPVRAATAHQGHGAH